MNKKIIAIVIVLTLIVLGIFIYNFHNNQVEQAFMYGVNYGIQSLLLDIHNTVSQGEPYEYNLGNDTYRETFKLIMEGS